MTANQRVLRGSENWREQTHKDPENQRPHWLEKVRFTSCVCVWASSLQWALLFLAICRFQMASTLLVLFAEWLPVSFLPSLPPSLLPPSDPLSSLTHRRVSYRRGRGGGGGGGGWLEFLPPPRNLEIEYGYYVSCLHVTECKYVSSKCCLDILPQKQPERM